MKNNMNYLLKTNLKEEFKNTMKKKFENEDLNKSKIYKR